MIRDLLIAVALLSAPAFGAEKTHCRVCDDCQSSRSRPIRIRLGLGLLLHPGPRIGR